MLYKSLEDINSALKDIDPPIDLGLANMIARWTEDMGANPPEKRPEDPWMAAVAQFKELYEPNKDDKWVRKGKVRQRSKLQEAFKTIAGKKRPASDFLVVGDKDKPSSWHLPVKVNGRIDHRLMGAAWAALHKGYRGNKYKGPGKGEAIKDLKALYKKEEIPLPTEEVAEQRQEGLVEIRTPGSVDDYLQRVRQAFNKQFGPPPGSDGLMQYWVYETFKDHPDFGTSVIVDGNGRYYLVEFEEKDERFRFVSTDEWQEVIKTWMVVATEKSEADVEANTESGDTLVALAESIEGRIVSLNEAQTDTNEVNEPLVMDVCLIEPGWGNSRDNNYYPVEVLRRAAPRFVGSKMFEKDHTDDKSTRDWVSTISEIVGETDKGGPIAKVTVHDPSFAERVRLLSKGGLLEALPCSILARGMASEFEKDGKKGHKVESITEVNAVDWVTAAGAGGHAVALGENEQEADMDPTREMDTEEQEVSEGATKVTLSEDESKDGAKDGAKDKGQSHTEDQEQQAASDTEEGATEKYLSKDEVNSALEAAQLPAAARAKLKDGKYTEEELAEAIKQEKAYISELTEAGRPFGLGSISRQPADYAEKQTAADRAIDEVNADWLGVRSPKKAEVRNA